MSLFLFTSTAVHSYRILFISLHVQTPPIHLRVCLENVVCLFLWCHGKVHGLFAIWYTWQCCDSINIPFTAIYSSRGNHHRLWWTIIHGWGPFSFPRWLSACVCVCSRVCAYVSVLYHQKGSFQNTRATGDRHAFLTVTLRRGAVLLICGTNSVCLSLLCTPALWAQVRLFLLFNTLMHTSPGHIIIVAIVSISCSATCAPWLHPPLRSSDAQMRPVMSLVCLWSVTLSSNMERVKTSWWLFGKKKK